MNLALPIGQRVSLPGHFDAPVVLEDARPLGNDGAGGYECRVRLPDGSLDEAIISVAEAQALAATSATPQTVTQPVDAERLRLLIESARIRLAYAYDRQFAVSLSGIRTCRTKSRLSINTCYRNRAFGFCWLMIQGREKQLWRGCC